LCRGRQKKHNANPECGEMRRGKGAEGEWSDYEWGEMGKYYDYWGRFKSKGGAWLGGS